MKKITLTKVRKIEITKEDFFRDLGNYFYCERDLKKSPKEMLKDWESIIKSEDMDYEDKWIYYDNWKELRPTFIEWTKEYLVKLEKKIRG